LQTAVNQLTKKGVNKIIALTHLGWDVDVDLAKNVTGVDIYIGGHSHSFTYNPAAPISFSPPTFPQFGPLAPVDTYPAVVQDKAGEPVLVVTAYQWGTFLGNLNVIFTPDGKIIYNARQPDLPRRKCGERSGAGCHAHSLPRGSRRPDRRLRWVRPLWTC
jgi:5'-nucleotidase / UDP-sugar diphosphatase